MREQATDPLALETLVEAQRSNALDMELWTLLSATVVISADHVIEIAPRISKMFFDRPTPTTIYKEFAFWTLEQILPYALEFGCLDKFVKIPIQRTSSELYELITQHLKTCAPNIAALPDNDSPRREFSEKHGQLIMEAICSVIADYEKLFHRDEGNCAVSFSQKFAAKAVKLRASLSAPSRTPLNVLSNIQEALVNLTIKATEAVLEKSPQKSVFDISAEVVNLALQHILPGISAAGQLWGFGNGLKSESSFFKTFKTAIEDSGVIMAQIPEVKEKKRSADAEDSAEKGKKKKAPTSAKNLARYIITKMKKTTAGYFDVFHKRETFGNLASPL
jgi:hypothetical protein